MIITKTTQIINNSKLLLLGCSLLLGASINAQNEAAIPSGPNFEQLIPVQSNTALDYVKSLQNLPAEDLSNFKASKKKRSNTVINGLFNQNVDLTISAGQVVTVTSTGHLQMGYAKKINVEPGGKLIIDGGKITGQNGQYWHGINVHGPENIPQTPSTHGVLEMKNGARLEDGRFAIRNYKQGVGGQGGGIIKATDSYIINSHIGAHLSRYNSSDNISFFKNYSFEVNDQSIWNNNYFWGILSWATKGIDVEGCTIIDARTSIPNSDKMGTGIYSYDGSFNVTQGTNFENLKDGFVIEASGSGLASFIGNSSFKNVHKAVLNKNHDDFNMEHCTIEIGTPFGFAITGNEAIYCEGAHNVNLSYNNITGPSTAASYYTGIHFNGLEYVTDISLMDNYMMYVNTGMSIHRVSGTIGRNIMYTANSSTGVNLSGSRDLDFYRNAVNEITINTNTYATGIEYFGSPSDFGVKIRCNAVSNYPRGMVISTPNFSTDEFWGNGTSGYSNVGLVLSNLKNQHYKLGFDDWVNFLKAGHRFGGYGTDLEVNGAGSTTVEIVHHFGYTPTSFNLNGATVTNLIEINEDDFLDYCPPSQGGTEPSEITNVSTANDFELKLFPNPANAEVSFNAIVDGSLEIFSLEGKTLQSHACSAGQRISINTSDMTNGIYLCRYSTKHGVVTSKLKIQH